MTILLPPIEFRDKCPWLLDVKFHKLKLKKVKSFEKSRTIYKKYNFGSIHWDFLCTISYTKREYKCFLYKWLEMNNVDFPKHKSANGDMTTKLNYKKLYYLLNKNLG